MKHYRWAGRTSINVAVHFSCTSVYLDFLWNYLSPGWVGHQHSLCTCLQYGIIPRSILRVPCPWVITTLSSSIPSPSYRILLIFTLLLLTFETQSHVAQAGLNAKCSLECRSPTSTYLVLGLQACSTSPSLDFIIFRKFISLPGWSQTQRSSGLGLPGAGIKSLERCCVAMRCRSRLQTL